MASPSKMDFNRPIRLDKSVAVDSKSVMKVLKFLDEEEKKNSVLLTSKYKDKSVRTRQPAKDDADSQPSVRATSIPQMDGVSDSYDPYAFLFPMASLRPECSYVSVAKISLRLIREHRNDIFKSIREQESDADYENIWKTQRCVNPRCRRAELCQILPCQNGCGESLHVCLQESHDLICKRQHKTCWTDFVNNGEERQSANEYHQQCDDCFDINCLDSSHCNFRKCANDGCKMKLHQCKQAEHNNICPYKVIDCINRPHGCVFAMRRFHLANHLLRCKAMDWLFLSVLRYNPSLKREYSTHHCDGCFSQNCTEDVREECRMVECSAACGLKFHKCKLQEHNDICPHGVVKCINKDYGCPMVLTRSMMATHLLHCPSMNWSYLRAEGQRLCSRENDMDDGPYRDFDANSYISLLDDEHIYQSIRFDRFDQFDVKLPTRVRKKRATKVYEACSVM